MFENRPGRPLFHDASGVQHRHAIGVLGDDAKVVRNEDHRRAEFVAQFAQQIEDLRLHGDVERGGRLVGDEQRRFADQRHRDHDALAHAAGKLMRIGIETPLRRRQLHLAQELYGALAGFTAAGPAVPDQTFRDLVADGQRGIEARHRILEDHR